MHQQPRATEQPLALKIVSRSGQRAGVSGRIESVVVGTTGAGVVREPRMLSAPVRTRHQESLPALAMDRVFLPVAEAWCGRQLAIVNDIVNI